MTYKSNNKIGKRFSIQHSSTYIRFHVHDLQIDFVAALKQNQPTNNKKHKWEIKIWKSIFGTRLSHPDTQKKRSFQRWRNAKTRQNVKFRKLVFPKWSKQKDVNIIRIRRKRKEWRLISMKSNYKYNWLREVISNLIFPV